ncbi:MAG TPA: 3-hydroxyacyl-CoA dehydrogenase [Geminicoccaceae bacterium]|nr:3-hydroxyacyl-CoA dehydrogenase [Geminicoccus sp.]HMU52919.1 3-hydroxyacyl-CoA dehydrogenase [Geminicoccaceae bacterium]
MSRSSDRAAILGSGLIGRAWAIAFARAGWTCALWDPQPGAPEQALREIDRLLADLAEGDLLRGRRPAEVLARIEVAGSLAEAMRGAAWAQESAPERIEVKLDLWRAIDAAAEAGTILASSSSAIVPSRFTESLAARQRCLVAHPINPPYLIPAVELVPAPWTAAETMARAAEIMRAIGQAPIVMRREIDAFVMNRMQGALLEEAFRLVADGVCSVEDVDTGIRDGLALRWSFMGPFETIDLNAPGGVADYIQRYQGIYERLFPQMQRRVDWAGEVLATVERERRQRLPESGLADRQRWRDRRLMALLRHKAKAADEIG